VDLSEHELTKVHNYKIEETTLVVIRPFVTLAQQPPVGQGLLNVQDSWSHSDTPHSVGLLWTSDQPDAETSDNTHTKETDGGTRTHNLKKRAAADPRQRPRGHWDRLW